MGKVVVFIGMTLDGFIAGPHDEFDWLQPYESVDYGYKGFIEHVGLIICGKRTYDLMKKHGWGDSFERPAIILSNEESMTSQNSNVTSMKGDMGHIINEAKTRTNQDIWIMGGAAVVQEAIKSRVVDELVLGIVPLLLGGGISLFGSMNIKKQLTLQKVKQFDKGLVQLTYTSVR